MREQLVSVIIPTFNVQKHIEKCLKNTLAQTYDNLEIIIVDDGSSDRTVQICEQYALEDSRIRLIKAEHRGVSATRNKGLDNAHGELVAFFDADDYPDVTVIEEYVRAFEQWGDSVSFVLCGMYWDKCCDKLFPREKHILEAGRGFLEGNDYLIQNHDASMLSWNKLFNFITNKCYRLSDVKSHNIEFKANVQIAEDMLFNIDYLGIPKDFIGVINKPLYHYVKHGEESLSTSYYDGAIEHVCNSFDSLLDFVCKQPGVSKDDEYVIESIYLIDWVSRLSMLIDDKKSPLSKRERYKICNAELNKPKFKEILRNSFKSRKISGVRYLSLNCCRFEIYSLIRRLYQRAKRGV